MRAYYLDNITSDPRLPHDSGVPIDNAVLISLGVLVWHIPLPSSVIDDYPEVDAVARERGYDHRDVINVTREGLGDLYEDAIKGFYHEHMHDIEETRYILEGSGFWDIREYPSERWIRFTVDAGDFVILPPGMYHRFTLDENDVIKAMRFSKDKLGRSAYTYDRDQATDVSPSRVEYLNDMATK